MKQAQRSNFFHDSWDQSWTYIKTVVDVVQDPILILNEDLCVIAANPSYYRLFKAVANDVLDKPLSDLGSGQWDSAALRKSLKGILTKNTFFKGLEVTQAFPTIGRKTFILNARRIYEEEKSPPVILLVIDDVTEMMEVADLLAHHAKA